MVILNETLNYKCTLFRSAYQYLGIFYNKVINPILQ